MIEYILPIFVEQSYKTSVWFSRSMSGIDDAAKALRLNYVFLQSIDELSKMDKDINIVIIISSRKDWTQNIISELRKMNIKIILTGETPSEFGEDISGPVLNRRLAVEEMVYYFYHSGKRRLAAVGNDPYSTNDNIRCEAFLDVTNHLKMPTSTEDIFFSDSDYTNCIERFLDNVEKYDGVICPNDYVAVCLLEAASKRNIRVPEDLFVAGSGDFMIGRFSTPTLTTTTTDYYEMGIQAVNIWSYLVKNPKISSLSITISCEMIYRGSTNFLPPPEPYIFEPYYTPVKLDTRKGPTLLSIRKLEQCLQQCDKLDLNIIRGVLDNKSIEILSEELFASPGTIRYRLKKMYSILEVSSRAEFHDSISKYIKSSEALTDTISYKKTNP